MFSRLRVRCLLFLLSSFFSIALAGTALIDPGLLHLIIDLPGYFKSSRPIYTQINPGTPIVVYGFRFEEDSLFADIVLWKNPYERNAWHLRTSDESYSARNTSKNLKPTYSIIEKASLYSILAYEGDFGKNTNIFFKEKIYKDGSVELDIENEDFIRFESESSPLKIGSVEHLQKYPSYGYLYSSDIFCSLETSEIKVTCEKS